MKILLDTNFILSCVRQKIDFYNYINENYDEGVEFLVPEEVLEELKKISERKGEKIKDKESAKVILKIIEKLRIKKIKLNKKHVDDGIVNYLKNKKIILATLDRDLKKRVKNKILTIRGKKKLEII